MVLQTCSWELGLLCFLLSDCIWSYDMFWHMYAQTGRQRNSGNNSSAIEQDVSHVWQADFALRGLCNFCWLCQRCHGLFLIPQSYTTDCHESSWFPSRFGDWNHKWHHHSTWPRESDHPNGRNSCSKCCSSSQRRRSSCTFFVFYYY